ncbi:MAG TPA: YciI family protein [Dehalococcoidia bacterium]|nr:YciI family protein [Dehalococcoidia bacterium]
MQFVLVIYHGSFPLPGTGGWDELGDAEKKEIYAEYAAVNQTPGITLRLPPIAPGEATTVRVASGKVEVNDGPHLVEGIAGAFAMEAESIDDAIALAARIPQARLGGAVEIRRVEKYF